MWAQRLPSWVTFVAFVSLHLAAEAASREFLPPSPPKYIILLSRQRSSSTTMSYLLGQHPCSLHGNEMWYPAPRQDVLHAHRHTDMSPADVKKDPHAFLNSVHDEICNEAIESGKISASCEGKCAIVIKTFDIHHLSLDGIFSMMEDPEFRFVVLERKLEDEYCSYLVATIAGDYGTVPSEHIKGSADNITCGSPPEEYADKHVTWFRTMRDALRTRGTFFVDVPFALVASCRLQEVIPSILAFMGLNAPYEVEDMRESLETLFLECDNDGGN